MVSKKSMTGEEPIFNIKAIGPGHNLEYGITFKTTNPIYQTHNTQLREHNNITWLKSVKQYIHIRSKASITQNKSKWIIRIYPGNCTENLLEIVGNRLMEDQPPTTHGRSSLLQFLWLIGNDPWNPLEDRPKIGPLVLLSDLLSVSISLSLSLSLGLSQSLSLLGRTLFLSLSLSPDLSLYLPLYLISHSLYVLRREDNKRREKKKKEIRKGEMHDYHKGNGFLKIEKERYFL
jgi:hypothetical protein